MPRDLPSFDLVVATVGRVEELGRVFDSVAAQDYERLRVIVVDQNEDDRLAGILNGREIEIVRLHSERGLSRARNVALSQLTADVVAFPDDDCVYPPGLLNRVAERLSSEPDLDGLTGRAEDASGASSASWKRDAAVLTDDNLWNRAISFTIFLRRAVVERVSAFDERLGLGSDEPWSSGEEIDYLIRAVRGGARIEYDPSLVVHHDVRVTDASVAYRDGASVGYLLRKHRYPSRSVARMLARPLGGIVVSIAQLDLPRASYHASTLRGRVAGYRGASRSKISR
ncbi:MAG TPA: glycosyltransferase family A protein [Gaiellaceae bacterium]|nr:glycosyltransferase family A protein [Gaiellaceae bacterium]